MATQNKIPTLGFGASIAAVVLLGFGAGGSVEQTGLPDYVVTLPVDDVVVQLPADTLSVLLPVDDDQVIL